jgi:hypothetical protein
MYVGPWRHVPAAYVRARARARAVVNESMNWWLAISTSPSVCFKKKKKDKTFDFLFQRLTVCLI